MHRKEKIMNSELTIRRRMLAMTLEARGNVQQTRENFMNRVRCLVYRLTEGLSLDEVPDEKEMKSLGREYNDKMLPGKIESLLRQGKISPEDQEYFNQALEVARKARSEEGKQTRPLARLIEEEPIWVNYLSHIRGIAEVLASNLISRLGECENSPKVSSLWRYCGLHIVCPTCTETREDEKTYPVLADNEGKCPKCGANCVGEKRRTGVKLDFNDSNRELCFKIVDCLNKTNSPIYKDIYDQEKQRQLARVYAPGVLKKMYPLKKKKSDEEPKEIYKEEDTHLSLNHAHKRAIRKVAKIFLQNYWEFVKTMTKQEITKPYVHAIKGHVDMISWKDIMKANGQDPDEILKAIEDIGKKTDTGTEGIGDREVA